MKIIQSVYPSSRQTPKYQMRDERKDVLSWRLVSTSWLKGINACSPFWTLYFGKLKIIPTSVHLGRAHVKKCDVKKCRRLYHYRTDSLGNQATTYTEAFSEIVAKRKKKIIRQRANLKRKIQEIQSDVRDMDNEYDMLEQRYKK